MVSLTATDIPPPFDGIAYRSDGNGSRDTLIVEAGEEEGIYLAHFPLEDIREYRKAGGSWQRLPTS